MDRIYYDVFRELTAHYSALARYPLWLRLWPLRARRRFTGYDDPVLIRWAQEAIDGAAADMHVSDQLRPDARHFLLVNLYEMVLKPAAAEPMAPPVELRGMMRADARSILAEARAEPNISEDGEISSGAVLRSTARLWPNLRINDLHIWGVDDRERGQAKRR